MSYQPATATQIKFLGDLMRMAGYSTEEEVSEYQRNLARLAEQGDPYASAEKVLGLIDYNLDQYANHLFPVL
jgi:hypothetical protein